MRGTSAVLVVLAIGLAGCALRPQRPVLPPGASAQSLLAELDSRRAALRSLRARVQIRSGLAQVWAREAVLVRRPGDVRVDVLSPFGLALALGTDGDVLWVFPPQDGRRYEGKASPENLGRFLGAPVRIEDLVDVLLGVPPRRIPASAARLERAPDGMVRVVVPLVGGAQRLDFAGRPLCVRRAEEERDGQVVLQVDFDDYRDGFPHRVDVTAPGARAAARLRYVSVEPNVRIDDAVFRGPRGVPVLPLERVDVRR